MTGTHERFAVFGFAGTHEAMRGEAALLEAGCDAVLIPTPKALGTLCGLAARVPVPERVAALEALARVGITPDGEIEMVDRVAGPL